MTAETTREIMGAYQELAKVGDLSLTCMSDVIVDQYKTAIVGLHVVGSEKLELDCLLKFEGSTNDGKAYVEFTVIMSREDAIVLATDILEGNNYANDIPN